MSAAAGGTAEKKKRQGADRGVFISQTSHHMRMISRVRSGRTRLQPFAVM
jgi:hypothetical protein